MDQEYGSGGCSASGFRLNFSLHFKVISKILLSVKKVHKMNKNRIAIIIVTLLFPLIGMAQIDTMALKTPEGICAKMLEFISFEKGESKDWNEYRNLFLPSAQKLSFRPKSGTPLHRQVRASNLEEFVRSAGPGYSKNGFEEYVIGVDVKAFNGIASVFQSFYCKSLDGSYEARGVNAYHLVFLNNRWWIASTMFINETDDVKLPNDLLFEKYQSTPPSERVAVKTAIEDYVLGLYEANPTRIERSVDTTLSKVGYWFNEKENQYADNLEMTYEELHSLSKTWNAKGDKVNPSSIKKITLHEVNDKTALGKVEAVWGVDYFQLAKVEGKWKIKNIIWQSHPPKN